MQEKNAKSAAKLIEKKSLTDDDFNDYIEDLAYKNNLCISVYNDYGEVEQYNAKMPGCNFQNKKVTTIIYDFINGSDSNISKKIELQGNNKGYLYAIKNANTDIVIYTTLRQNNSVSTLMENQLIYIIIISIIISSALAIYISNLITKPIRNITKTARNIGKENYQNRFIETGIIEIDELSQTLDNVQKELGKVEEYQNDLLANVTHDLKTPLTMIKAYAEKIKDISYKDKSKLDTDVKVIIDEADRLTILVNDILEMSKINKDKKLELENYDLVTEINNIMTRYDIIKDNEKYNFEIIAPEKALVRADKKRINQVIYNLINNAINYTGDDKKVTIKVTSKGKYYLVQIIDTGKGIAKEDINNIWTKYYKNDKNHQRNVISSGIGLSIVKQILENHNFDYGVNSEINKGSTFYFKISSANIHTKNTKER